MMQNNTIQDKFLNVLRKTKTPVTFFLINGFQMRGTITHFDNFVVLIESTEGKQHMIFKHAISTLVPQKPVELSSSDSNKKVELTV